MNIQAILTLSEPFREQLLNHPLYCKISSPEGMRQFMEVHCFAVWDFMSLLKALQRRLTCVDSPWLPPADPVAARMINEIVLGEESDLDPDGAPSSHFDLYLQSMKEAGADTGPIEKMICRLRLGDSLSAAMQVACVPKSAQAFMNVTFGIIEEGSLPTIAAAFTIGRENLIPGLFRGIVQNLQQLGTFKADRFLYYLDRHIGLDEEEHGPLAFKILERLCGDSPQHWQNAESATMRSLQARLELWNSIEQTIAGS